MSCKTWEINSNFLRRDYIKKVFQSSLSDDGAIFRIIGTDIIHLVSGFLDNELMEQDNGEMDYFFINERGNYVDLAAGGDVTTDARDGLVRIIAEIFGYNLEEGMRIVTDKVSIEYPVVMTEEKIEVINKRLAENCLLIRNWRIPRN